MDLQIERKIIIQKLIIFICRYIKVFEGSHFHFLAGCDFFYRDIDFKAISTDYVFKIIYGMRMIYGIRFYLFSYDLCLLVILILKIKQRI